MTKQTLLLTAALVAAATAPGWGAAKNVIPLVGDGAGVSSLNAASLYGYQRPQALHMQRMPHLALAVTPGGFGVPVAGKL